jgi:RNA polymerase sigma-70 factor (ECF subfamily)
MFATSKQVSGNSFFPGAARARSPRLQSRRTGASRACAPSSLKRLLQRISKVAKLSAPVAKAVSDKSLLLRFRHGDEDAATQLYRRYAPRLHLLLQRQCSTGLTRRVDADDIVQSVFCAFFEQARKGLYDIPDGEDLWQLMMVIALNKLRTKRSFHHAARRDVRRTASDDHLESQSEQNDVNGTLLRLAFNEALERMTEQERRMVELLIEGHEVAEIAAAVDRSKRTVERNLQTVRQKLSRFLEEDLRHD